MADTRTIEIEVLRYDPEKDAAPHFQSFQVPFSDDTSVLQGLLYIKDHLDGSLTLPLVVPHGDLRQLRLRWHGASGALLPHVPARLLPDRCASSRWPFPGGARPGDRPGRFPEEAQSVKPTSSARQGPWRTANTCRARRR
jgi:hypothetical protein